MSAAYSRFVYRHPLRIEGMLRRRWVQAIDAQCSFTLLQANCCAAEHLQAVLLRIIETWGACVDWRFSPCLSVGCGKASQHSPNVLIDRCALKSDANSTSPTNHAYLDLDDAQNEHSPAISSMFATLDNSGGNAEEFVACFAIVVVGMHFSPTFHTGHKPAFCSQFFSEKLRCVSCYKYEV